MTDRAFSASAVEDIERRALAALAEAKTVDDVRAAHAAALGKRGELTALNALLRDLDAEARKAAGSVLNATRATITAAFERRLSDVEAEERAARLDRERLDLTEVAPGPQRGSLSLVTQTRDALEDTFVGMGFVVAEGPEVESDWHNFEALNMPPAHPARSGFDTLYLDWGAPETTLLRTHTSPVQIRLMLEQRPPVYAVMPGRVYRKDTPDTRHTPSFSQIEGLVVDHGITFGDLAGTIDTFTRAYFGPAISARLRPAYFPFTEPSAEFEITCTICEGAGCRTCSWTGFAFGFGIDRLAQMRFGIPDMRVLADNDLRFTTQF